jgi:hypothetical protein
MLAMAGLGVGAVLFVWAIGALLDGSGTPAVRGAANVRPNGVPPVSTAPSGPPSNPPSSGQLASASASPGPSATPSGTPSATTTTTSRPPPGPPKACPDSVLRVTVTTGQRTYRVGDQPLFTLHIANAGPVPCVRDVSRQLRSIEVRSGRAILWSSGYCYTLHTNEIRTLRPGRSLAYSVAWAGRTSAPGCPAHRTTVPAGRYELIGRLATVTGPATPLILT